MLWLAVGHSVSAVPLQGPFCHRHPFLSQVSQPPPLFLLPTIRLLRRAGMPLCILPPHLVRIPRPLCLLGSPLCCPALLPKKLGLLLCGPAPREALPKAPLPSGSAFVQPSAPLAGAFPLAPDAFPSASGLSEDLASSANPSVCTPARSPEGRAPCVVEIFAGSCNFSSTAVSMGFQSIAVDHVPAKRWHVLQLDLREPGAQQLLLSTLRCLLPALVVLAPPCGTASRARDIPAYSNGKRIAHPLRSGQHPDGLPSLQGHDLARVTSANSLYAFTAAVAGMCSQHGIPWLIENPARSYMWDTCMMSALAFADRGPLLRLWGCSPQAHCPEGYSNLVAESLPHV